MFLNLVMLAGIGAAVIPLVLHLLSRARCRDLHWGAMMFLEPGPGRHRNPWRVRQWTLLAVRTLLVLLLAIGLARPVIGRGLSLSPVEGTIAVIVIDCSYSMAIEEAGQTRFDKARQAVLQVLSSFRKGDQVGLVLLTERTDARPPSANLQAVARDVAELRVSNGAADMAAGLSLARQMLERSALPSRELYVVCDRQAASWQTVLRSPQSATASISPSPRFNLISVGGDAAEGIAIEGMDLVDPVAVRGQPADVEVRLRNFGPRVGANIELKLLTSSPDDAAPAPLPQRELRTMRVTVPANSSSVVRAPVVLTQSGSHILTARLAGIGPEPDLRFDTAVDVIDPIQVLIVSGDERSEGIGRESFFLDLALAPRRTVQGRSGDPAIVSIRAHPQWNAAELARYQVVILANVPEVSPEQARALEQRVSEGAGLIICPGNLARLDNYNGLLYGEGQGLLPATLAPATPADGSRATGLLGLELTHPVFRFRRGTDPLPSAVVGRYFPATPRRSDAHILATYASGEPFLIDGPRGRGHVLLVTTPLDADWNTLPLYPFYLPFVQSMVRYVCAPSLPPRNLEIGRRIVASLDGTIESAQIVRPDATITSLPVSSRTTQVPFSDTRIPGIYRLIIRGTGSARVLHFVVQPPRTESDPAALTAAQWQLLQRDLGFTRLDPTDPALSDTLTSRRRGFELSLPLILAVIALGTGELWLAGRWSREPA